MLYDDFKPIVDIVLNNWTALQLAVEHGMGAPGGNQVSIDTVLHTCNYLGSDTIKYAYITLTD